MIISYLVEAIFCVFFGRPYFFCPVNVIGQWARVEILRHSLQLPRFPTYIFTFYTHKLTASIHCLAVFVSRYDLINLFLFFIIPFFDNYNSIIVQVLGVHTMQFLSLLIVRCRVVVGSFLSIYRF